MDVVLFVVILVVLFVGFIGLAVLVLRGMRYLPLHRYAVVSRRWGWPHRITSREEFLRRTRIVLGGQPVWPWLYQVDVYDYVSIPPGTVGLVVAKVGAHTPASRQLARHVECGRFQDARRFLDNGGEHGAQPELLRDGEDYAPNRMLFDVYTVDNVPDDFPGKRDDLRLVSVDSEDVGVVIVTDAPTPDDLQAPAPPVPDHDYFQKPWVFLANGGRSGPQSDILPGGAKYAINPMFARVVHIPTRELVLTWGAKSGSEDRYDSELGPLRVTIEGFEFEVELTQTLAIPPHAAPYLVKRFGEDADGDVGDRMSMVVKRFVGRVLGEKVRGYFTERANGGEIDKFLRELADIHGALKVQIAQALAEVQVEARETTIGELRFASDELNQEYRKFVQLQQQYRQLEQELAIQRVTEAVRREQLKAVRERYVAQEQTLSDLFGLDHRKLERLSAIRGQANQQPVILAGGATTAYLPPRVPLIERITVPLFDPAAYLRGHQVDNERLPSPTPIQARVRCEPDEAVPGRASRVWLQVMATGADEPLAEPCLLRVLLDAMPAVVTPVSQSMMVDIDRTAEPVEFEVTVLDHRPLPLVFRLYRESDSQLLLEITAHLPVHAPEVLS